MKIIQTPPRFCPRKGGIEEISFCLSRELVRRGHQIKVICADEPRVGNLKIEGIEVRRLAYIGKISNTNITLSLPKELIREDFDILHTHLPHPWSADISALISLFKNKPLFLTYYNDITGKGLNRFIANFYNVSALQFLFRRAHKIFITHKGYIKTSPFLKPFLNKIIITLPGIDQEKFKFLDVTKDNTNIVFFLSRLDRFHLYKGLDYLLFALKQIIHKIPLKLYVGGEGELINYYKAFVKENNLENIVYFLGSLDDEELIKYYNLCGVFVLPSISATQEGFGLVALEAMACKKPVIVTEITGVAEDIKARNAGIVIKPKNVNELSEALEYLFSNERQRKIMGENAYRLVTEKYTWQKHVDIIEREYLKAVR